MRLAVSSLIVLCCIAGRGTTSLEANPARVAATASHVRGATGIFRGICTLLGGDDGEFLGRLAVELGWDDGFLVHVWADRDDVVEQARKIAADEGLHGRSVIVEKGNPERLPYADSTVDIVVASAPGESSGKVSLKEVLRVLRPGGKALLASVVSAASLEKWLEAEEISGASMHRADDRFWATVTKPRPAGEGDWSHIEHGPDNNPVAEDALIKAPYMTKWLGQPYYIAMPAITVAASGRIFLATGHIAHHQREEAWLNTLIARNGYNGTILWKRKLPDGYLVHRSAFVATGDNFHMIDADGSGCLVLDAETGEERGRIDLPSRRGQWKWMAIQDGILLALVGSKKDPPETTIIRRKGTGWSWGELSKGYYPQRVPWGFGEKIVAFDLESRKVLWQHTEKTPVDSRGMVIGGGRTFYYCPDALIGCLDLKTGKQIWTNPADQVRKLIEQQGRGLSSTPGFRTMNFCLYTPDVLVFQAQTRQNVVALSTRDGYLLWHREKTTNNPNALSIDNQLVLGIGDQGSSLLVDPRSGTTVGDLGFAKRSCARLTATSDSLFCRGMPEGLTRFDRRTKKISFNGAVRPSCNDGVVAANGLLYMGPWACDCNLTLIGRVVMCSAGNFAFRREADDGDDGVSARGDVDRVVSAVTDGDWETYRGNSTRGASTPVAVAGKAIELWTFEPQRPFLPTAPTTAAGLVFIAGDDGAVRALDAVTGGPRWTFYTAGSILQPPTIADGRAYVGSGDGFVYCLDVGSGELLWRFRAAPVERRIPVYGSLSSTWPVHSGVLVRDGVAYAAAGIIDYDGTFVYALDARTGRIIWQNDSTGHLDPELRKGVSAQGFLTAAAGRLWMPGGNVVSPASYDLATGVYRGSRPEDGSPRANRGEEIGVFRDRHLVVGGRLRFSPVENIVSPGYFNAHGITASGVGGESRIQNGKIAPAWNDRYIVVVPGPRSVPVWYDAAGFEESLAGGEEAKRRGKAPPAGRAALLEGADTVSVALAANAVLTVSRKPDPGNRLPRWTLSALDLAGGEPLWQQTLPDAAIAGGLAVDRDGRVLVVLEGGRLVCFGGTGAFHSRLDRLLQTARRGEKERQEVIDQLLDVLGGIYAVSLQEPMIAALEKFGVVVDAEARKRGSLTRWHIVGPVPWKEGDDSTAAVIAGGSAVDAGGAVDISAEVAVGDHTMRWHPYRTVDANGEMDLAAIHGSLASVAVYAYAEFDLPAGREVVLRLGSNDGFTCWFNGAEVGRFDGGRGYVPDDDAIAVKGKAGVNRVLMKINQLGNRWSFGVRVTDQAGRGVAFKQ